MSTTEELYRQLVPRRRCDTYVYERTGHTMPWFVPARILDALQTFEVRESDVFLVTYPKSGTNWTRKIMAMVMNNADEQLYGTDTPFGRKVIYPEMHQDEDEEPSYKKLEKIQGQRFIPTHLPPSLLPPQMFDKPVKIIYVARNPKDVVVSDFHHCIYSPFEEPSYCGEWGSHVIPWWKKRDDPNILFIKYEDMIKDLGRCVKKIASFLQQDHLTEEQIMKTVKLCTFENMKQNPVDRNEDVLANLWKSDISKNPFIRKGKVGGWKEYFTVAQNEKFDQVYKKWIGDSGLEMEFELG
ncbi:sulfotransferase 1B1-like isoform X2 [Ptychodera flava]|uniref:sulfotransferase 1B1-like isoform X2 n=1 Tax=Ptychodera flava TaxID=63121 RepID=UPI003969D067